MNRLHVTLAGATVLASLALPAFAASRAIVNDTILQTPLKCAMENVKILVVTNSTGATISAGTRIHYAFERMPDHAKISGSAITGKLLPGAVVKRGVGPAFSCTASFRKTLVLAPQP